MRWRYELLSMLLVLTTPACGTIQIDLLAGVNTYTPDAQTNGNDAQDASLGLDDTGTPVDDAGATARDAGAIPNDASQPDTGVGPILPNMAVNTDAGVVGPGDAAVGDAAAADAAAPPRDAGVDAATVMCAGKVVFGLCWYLGAQGDTCTNVCSAHGGYDTDATSWVGAGNQGGSLANCQQVLRALGETGTASEGTRSDALGLGCHIWNDGQPWWLSSPPANPDSAIPVARRACGCDR